MYFCFVLQKFPGVLGTEEGRLFHHYHLIYLQDGETIHMIFMSLTAGVIAGEI